MYNIIYSKVDILSVNIFQNIVLSLYQLTAVHFDKYVGGIDKFEVGAYRLSVRRHGSEKAP